MNRKQSRPPQSPENPGWFERNTSLIIGALVLACGGLLVAEWIRGPRFFSEHHPPHFELETFFAWQAGLGFVAFIVIVFLGKLLRLLIRREEDYYDR